MQFYLKPPPSYITKNAINTTTDEISTGGGALGSYWTGRVWKVIFEGKNQQNQSTVLPGELQEQTIYWIRYHNATLSFGVYLDEAETQKVDFTTANIADATTFTMRLVEQFYTIPECIHSAAPDVTDAICCPKNYTIENLPTHATVLFNAAAAVEEYLPTNPLVLRASGGEPRSGVNISWLKSLFVSPSYTDSGGPRNEPGVFVRDDFADSSKSVVVIHQYGRGVPPNDAIEKYRSAPYPHATLPNPVTCYNINDATKSAVVTFGKDPNNASSTFMRLPPSCRVVMPQAFIYGDRWTGDNGKYYLGNINEILTLDTDSGTYFSSLKNYYNIPGRLYLTTDFYPVDGRKVIKSGVGFVDGVVATWKYYASYNYQTNQFNYVYGFDPEGYRGINMMIGTSGTYQALQNWTYNSTWYFNVNSYMNPYDVALGQPWFDSRLGVGVNIGNNYDNYNPYTWTRRNYNESGVTHTFAISYAASKSARYPLGAETIANYMSGTPGQILTFDEPAWTPPQVQKTTFYAICSQSPSCYVTSLVR
jgi:hypothetical protein